VNDITKFPQRPTQRKEPPRPHHPDVLNFMERVRDREIQCDELADENARLMAELHASRQTVIDQAQTIRELTAQRDRETRKSVALEAHIEGIATACHAALKSAIKSEQDHKESIRLNEETQAEREERAAQHMRDTFGGKFGKHLIEDAPASG
jgi:hypothetical protein